MARTKRESDRRRREKNGRHVGAAETSKERAEWRRLQRRNWNILRLPKRKKWPHEEGENQDGREPHLGQSEGDQSESMEWEGWTPR